MSEEPNELSASQLAPKHIKIPAPSHFASSNHQELFGDAFLRAIAALADCEFSIPKPDQYKRDVKIATEFNEDTGYELLDPQLSIQVKTATIVSSETETDFGYKVDKPTYNSLRQKRVAYPRFLVVIRLPHHPEMPLIQDLNQTTLRQAPFFINIKGAAELPVNQESKVVRIPKANVLTPDVLRGLLIRAAKKEL